MRKVTTSIPAPSSLSVAAVARRWAIWRDSPLFPMQQVDDRRCRDEQDELGLWVPGCQVPRPLDQLGAGRGLVGDHEVARITLPMPGRWVGLLWVARPVTVNRRGRLSSRCHRERDDDGAGIGLCDLASYRTSCTAPRSQPGSDPEQP